MKINLVVLLKAENEAEKQAAGLYEAIRGSTRTVESLTCEEVHSLALLIESIADEAQIQSLTHGLLLGDIRTISQAHVRDLHGIAPQGSC